MHNSGKKKHHHQSEEDDPCTEVDRYMAQNRGRQRPHLSACGLRPDTFGISIRLGCGAEMPSFAHEDESF